MQHQSVQQRFSRLAAALTRSGYPDFFPLLVGELAQILGVEYVLIADTRGHAWQARTLAVSAHGVIAENFSYALRGTPCETVPEREMCSYRDGVVDLFPDDELLAQFGIESYTGMPVLTSDGRKLGILSAMSTRPGELDDVGREILRIAATQVGAELELAMNHERIRSLTQEDRITGLPNRERLHAHLTSLGDAPRLCLLDLRRFKEVNDLRGHEAGDRVLCEVAQRLREKAAERAFVARFSSDEFAVVPHAHWATEPAAMALEIRGWFQEPVHCDGDDYFFDISMGSAQLAVITPDIPDRAAELIRRASVALAEAKSSGGFHETFNPSMVDSLLRRQQLSERLLRALRTGGLSLHYQPQMMLGTGAVAGAEALCRWHDDQYGWVSPGVFIPLAEERGLIKALGEWVIAEATRQLQAWEAEGLRLPGRLAVNVSPRQLESGQAVESFVDAILPLEPQRFLLELTESAMMRTPESNLRQMRQLRDAGFEWAIDDFGTGYSSLSYLTRLNASVLKIDQSFVSKVPGSRHDESIVRTIIAMAESMGMGLLAEGIETGEQYQYLQSVGCLYGQGYHIGRPVPADEFARHWLRPN